jgi:hypothetical protein
LHLLALKEHCDLYNNTETYTSWALVAQAYNLSYSRGRNQEDSGSKLAWANGLRDPFLKISITKKGW